MVVTAAKVAHVAQAHAPLHRDEIDVLGHADYQGVHKARGKQGPPAKLARRDAPAQAQEALPRVREGHREDVLAVRLGQPGDGAGRLFPVFARNAS